MVTKKHFLDQMNKLMLIFDEQVPMDRIAAYYDVIGKDFTDEQFDVALNLAVKNSFKFPPVAAFYKKDAAAVEPPKVYDPVTEEEAKVIREARRLYESE